MKGDERRKVCGIYEEKKDTYSVLVGKTWGTRPLGRPKCRWKNNIKIDFQEIVSEVLNVINLAEDRHNWLAVLNTVMNLLVPCSAGLA